MIRELSVRRPLSSCALGLTLAALAAACDDGSSCSDEERIAIAITLTTPSGVEVSKVTAELKDERDCGFFSDAQRVYTCWEQGGGTYTIRVYSDDTVIHTEDVEIPWDGCHIEQPYVASIDLTQ